MAGNSANQGWGGVISRGMPPVGFPNLFTNKELGKYGVGILWSKVAGKNLTRQVKSNRIMFCSQGWEYIPLRGNSEG